ncbi:MAG: TRAP transporter TAXI family solute receptor [Pseudohongiellaceae bacterium]|jgi:TRAP transporter TAXI family solute receptor
MAGQGAADDRGEARRLWGLVGLISVAGCVVAWQFVAPAPPERLVLAAGGAQGSYAAFGKELAKQMSVHGLTIEVRETKGSGENIALLQEGVVDLAFVQSGLFGAAKNSESRKGLSALGSLFYEPLWIFHRSDVKLDSLRDLSGLRVAVGLPGGGTRPVATALCLANGVGPDDAQWIEETAAKSVDGLLAGSLDALFLVTSARSQSVRRLLDAQDNGVSLFDVQRHLAYERNFRALRHVVLAQGQLDFVADVPRQDIDLMAPVAMLITHEDLHPALIPILIEAAQAVFGKGGVFATPDEFPSPHYVDLPLSEHARRAYATGPSFLYEVLPFRVAATLSRLKIMLLPLLTLLIPLMKFAPPVYRWRIRSKIYRWYGLLGELEAQGEEAQTADDWKAVAAAVQAVELEVRDVSVPASYMDEYYNLRMHVDRLREQLRVAAAA